jgi:hypothetical protein
MYDDELTDFAKAGHYTVGKSEKVKHIRKIAAGGSGEVHQVTKVLVLDTDEVDAR